MTRVEANSDVEAVSANPGHVPFGGTGSRLSLPLRVRDVTVLYQNKINARRMRSKK